MKKAILAFAATLSFAAFAQAQTTLLQIKKAPFTEYMQETSYQKATVTAEGDLIIQLKGGDVLNLKIDADTLNSLKANVVVLEKAKIESYNSQIVCMMMPTAPRSHLFVGERLRAVYATGGCEYGFKLHPEDSSNTALAAAVVAKIDSLVNAEIQK